MTNKIPTPSGGTLHVNDLVKAFHPLTFGVMHSGKIKAINKNEQTVLIYFNIDKKKYTIPLNHVDVFIK